MSNQKRVFTGTITNSSFNIDTQDSITHISIKNKSTSSGVITVLGTLPIGSLNSSAIDVGVGEIITIGTGGSVIGSLTIVAAAGEFVDIIATQ
jgi:hypothetical protein|tara:strand:- start:83 stop:361 length:279 start_codon:yes stop_codon:yes gene_type:complete